MRQTSINAYNEIKNSGLLSKLRFEVYEAIYTHVSKEGPITQGECWKFYFPQRQRHDVCPRFAELESRGVIASVGKRPCRVTGIDSMVWSDTGNLPKEPEKEAENQILFLLFPLGGVSEKPKLFKSKKKALEWKMENQFSSVLHEVELIK